MELRTIGQDKVSSVALGTWVFAADCWGGADRRHCISAVCTALKNGINLIDTAPIYGHGRSETIIGEALKGRSEKAFIASKCGLPVRNGKIVHDLSPQNIVEEVEASLRRLDRDVIDLMQCHWPDETTPIEESMAALRKLQDQQKIRYIGVSNFGVDLLARAMKEADIVTHQVQYSLLQREMEQEVLPFCSEHNIGVLAYGPLGGGILTGKYEQPPELPKSDTRQFFYPHYQGKRFADIKRSLDALRAWDKPLAQIAINWVRQQPGITSVLVGGRNRTQVESNAEAGQWVLSDDQLKQLSVLTW